MSLTLRIQNRDRLENGAGIEFVLHRRGGLIGRSATNDWSLPDPNQSGISRRHCEIQYRDGTYFLSDLSQHGTFVNDSYDRLSGPHPIAPGDRISIGDYQIVAAISGDAREAFEREQQRAAEEASGGWTDWDDLPGATPRASTAADPAPAEDEWGIGEQRKETVSEWADRPIEGEMAPGGDDIFGSWTDSHQVDWTTAAWDVDVGSDQRFGDAPSEGDFAPLDGGPGADPFAPLDGGSGAGDPFAPLDPGARGGSAWGDPPTAPLPADPGRGREHSTARPGGVPGSPPYTPPPARTHHAPPPAARVPPPQAAPAQPPAPAQGSDQAFGQLLRHLGIEPAKLTEPPVQTAERAGRMMHRLVAGLMTLLEARARAKDQMGATATQLRFDGNNPLKFARSAEQALEMALNPPMRGYMDADRAVEDAFRDLQAHQIATLKAMQGALQATLKRFSPEAIKARTEEKGGLAKLIPGQRDAALWKAYEKEFGGVAQGSAEAFLDVFSKEFRDAYEQASRGS